jgi:hypothetical protein
LYGSEELRMTEFEGTWIAEGFSDENVEYKIRYQFADNDFTLTNMLSGFTTYGSFEFDDAVITFRAFVLNQEWNQNYRLTDTYLDLQIDEEKHFCGRFFKR